MKSVPPSAALAVAYAAALSRLATRLGPHWTVSDSSEGRPAWRLYRIAEHGLPRQGWKVHVSASAAQRTQFMERVADALATLAMPFKFPASLRDRTGLSEKPDGTQHSL